MQPASPACIRSGTLALSVQSILQDIKPNKIFSLMEMLHKTSTITEVGNG